MDRTGNALLTGMQYYENRLKTYDTYPKQMLPDKYELASAGLYYIGESDVCECFSCHIKLNAWERGDNAMKEHYKWSPNCEYLKIVGTQRHIGGLNTNAPNNSTYGANLFMKRFDTLHYPCWRNVTKDAQHQHSN